MSSPTTMLTVGNICAGGTGNTVDTATNMCAPGLCCMLVMATATGTLPINEADKVCAAYGSKKNSAVTLSV